MPISGVMKACLVALISIIHVSAHSCSSLLEAGIDDLRRGLENGDFSSVNLVNAYTARIQEVNGTLQAVTELNPDALAIARDLDRERRRGKLRGPLHGVPVLVKNNIATNDRMTTTAGSYALLKATVPRDATVVAKLRQAGAIILGKSNLSQWAAFRSLNTSMGWSAYGGQTVGAYLRDQDPNGSSSGSAVSVSVGLAVAALGTETYGSIILPAGANNVVGIKPTVGLTSRNLIVPVSEHQDSVGPLAKTVKDAAYLLQAIAGPDRRDNYTLASPFQKGLPNYVAACRKSSLKGRRFGVPRNVLAAQYNGISTQESIAYEEALRTIQAAGGTVVEANFTLLTSESPELISNVIPVVVSDFIANLAAYLSQLRSNPNQIKSLQDVLDFTTTTPVEDYPRRDVQIFQLALGLKFSNTDAQAYEARQNLARLGGEGAILGAISRKKLDAVLLPTTMAYYFEAIIGTPAISVPLGAYPDHTPIQLNAFGNLVSKGPNYPFGLTFLGKHWSEADLVSYAYSFEQITRTREKIKPFIKPNAELC